VILAIAFQISEGLAMETKGGGPGISDARDERSDDPSHQSGVPVIAETSSAIASASSLGEETGPDQHFTETPPIAVAGLDQAEELTSAAPESGNMPGERQGTPTPPREINPADGHTVSAQPVDEIEERARKGPLRQDSRTRVPNVTSNDPSSPRAPVLEAPNGAAGVAAPEAAPAIEMIRGTRRSTEPIAASENED
jgi:hypothetical protein